MEKRIKLKQIMAHACERLSGYRKSPSCTQQVVCDNRNSLRTQYFACDQSTVCVGSGKATNIEL